MAPDPIIAALLAQDDRRMLCVSPLHLTYDTFHDTQDGVLNWPSAVIPTRNGFIMYCPTEKPDGVDDEGADLWAVLELARAYGYDYVMFDADCDPYPEFVGLKSYDH